MKSCPEGGYCQFTPDYNQDGVISCERCGLCEEPPSEMELAFRLVETAIDAHPRFSRVGGIAGEPKIVMERSGVSLRIVVKLGAWGKPSEIRGEGPSMAAAAADLVGRLETWWLTWLCGLQATNSPR